MNRSELLTQLYGVGLLVQDLRLFLDVNPANATAMADFRHASTEYKNLVATYEKHYGPLSGCHDTNGTWVANPWPWHNDMGGNV